MSTRSAGLLDCGDQAIRESLEDLDGFWEYPVHPVHFEAEKWGLPFIERFEAFDTTDSDDPEYGQKIAALQTRSYQENPAGRCRTR